MLSGPELRSARVLHSHPSWAQRPSVQQEGPEPIPSYMRNMVNPYHPRKGRSAVRPSDGGAGRGWRRKRRPGCNGPDMG